MRYLATDNAIESLNRCGLTENEVHEEFLGEYKARHDGDIGDLVLNWKNKDVIIIAMGKETCVMIKYGVEYKGSYEDFPEVIYKDNTWVKK